VADLPLDYRKLAPNLRLDTMQYFQFLYPGRDGFIRAVPCHDSTQFTVYVLKNGMARQIHVIELDRKPVYYSWTNQPKGYSFYVAPKGLHQITLRLSDRVLILDSISFERGKKTIISLDADHLPHGTKVMELENKFTQTEINRHRAYVAAFQATPGLYAYLQSPGEFVPVYSRYTFFKNSPSSGTIVAGPIVSEKKTYVEIESLKTTYRHIGGFRYVFEDNIVYKSDVPNLFPMFLIDSSFDPAQHIGDGAVNKKHFLEIQNRFPRPEVKWFASTFDLSDPAIRIRIFLPPDDGTTGIAALLFEDPVTKKIVPPSFNKYYHNLNGSFRLPRGFSSMIVLYEDGSYIRVDSIAFRNNTLIAADLSHAAVCPPDESSFIWLRENMSRPEDYSESINSPSWQRREIHYYQSDAGNVHGTVYDENNEPLPGTTILIRGTQNGTITDIEGNFSLQIDDIRATLEFSFVGYEAQYLQVTSGSVITVNMEPSVMALNEVVVVGYGTMSRHSLTGSVAGVSTVGSEISPPELAEEPEQIGEEQQTRQAESQLYQELRNLHAIRSNFSDVGFWEPRLVTDNKGKSSFSVTFPDDITRWNAVVYAMNRYLQTGTGRKSIQSYKPILAELSVPQFLTRGDSALFLGKVTNYTADSAIQGKVRWEGSTHQSEKEIRFTAFHADLIPVVASGADSITARFTFTRNDGYVDGEERSVEVTEQGIERAEGEWSIFNNGEVKHVKAGEGEYVTVTLLNSQIDLYAGEMDFLLHYRYDCNEQLASKLIGLINLKKLMQYQGKPFRFERDANTIIRRLLKNQNAAFLWSWWDVSGSTSYWMSAHVLKALKCAKDAGFNVELDIENVIRKAQYKFDILKEFSVSDVELLNALASWGADMDYSRYVPVLDSLVRANEQADLLTARRLFHDRAAGYSYLKEKLLLQEIRLIRGGYQRDSLVTYQREGMLGEVFFSDNKPGRSWYADNLAANTIAYRIIEKDSMLHHLLPGMQMYFFHSRAGYGWNTYQSSEILQSVLSTLLGDGSSKERIAEVALTGAENKTVHEFPCTVELNPGSELEVRKNSGIPLYFMHYVKERVTREKTGGEGFTIKTYFSRPGLTLEAGQPVDLVAEVTVQKDSPAEHVMLEVPIPGACSYADKRQGNAVETHREYFKEKTVIFCEKMELGTYVFHIKLLPRFTGTYYLNPAQVSLMYLPVVNANTDMKKLRVNP
jgi:hypothetical protein